MSYDKRTNSPKCNLRDTEKNVLEIHVLVSSDIGTTYQAKSVNVLLTGVPRRLTKICKHPSLRKHPFLLALRHWERFVRRNVCDLAGRNSVLMTQINVYIINPVVMGFQIQICPILRVFWSILVKCCVHLPTSSSKTQMLLLENSIFHKYWLFCSRFFVFTFDLCSLLSVIRKQ